MFNNPDGSAPLRLVPPASGALDKAIRLAEAIGQLKTPQAEQLFCKIMELEGFPPQAIGTP